jgi:predicted nucleic acid-binding protein
VTDLWCVNASPLIALSQIDRLDLLTSVASAVRVPRAVLEEVAPEARAVATVQSGAPYELVDDVPVDPRVSIWQLGKGETQVLSYALTKPGVGVVLDDRAARRCGKLLQIEMMGTLGIVARAKTLGHIPHAKPVLEALRSVGLFIDDALVRQVLEHLGESR